MKQNGMLVISFCMGCILTLLFVKLTDNKVIGKPDDKVLKTVWHTHTNMVDNGYELIAKDEPSDIAFYRCTTHYLIDSGDRVIGYNDISGRVTYVDANGFAFLPDNPDMAKPGISGTAIRNLDYVQIGIVQGHWPTGEIYCLWS